MYEPDKDTGQPFLGDVMPAPKSENEKGWKLFAFLVLGIAIGLMLGYLINTELAAKAKAQEICGVCIENFNILAKECNLDKVAFNLTPYIGTYNFTGGNNAS